MASVTFFDLNLNQLTPSITMTGGGAKGQACFIGNEHFVVTPGLTLDYYRYDIRNKTCHRVKSVAPGPTIDGICALRDTGFGQYEDGEYPMYGGPNLMVLLDTGS